VKREGDPAQAVLNLSSTRLRSLEGRAGFPHLGELNVDGAATDLSLVHGLKGLVSRALLRVGNEAESPAATSLAIIHNVGLSDGPELSEHLSKLKKRSVSVH
jgi:hypothetical protein